MATAANAIPAVISQGTCEGLRGKTPWKKDNLRDFLEFCAGDIFALFHLYSLILN
jgi:hypothetical protein